MDTTSTVFNMSEAISYSCFVWSERFITVSGSGSNKSDLLHFG